MCIVQHTKDAVKIKNEIIDLSKSEILFEARLSS